MGSTVSRTVAKEGMRCDIPFEKTLFQKSYRILLNNAYNHPHSKTPKLHLSF